jgi:hypothetical protein
MFLGIVDEMGFRVMRRREAGQARSSIRFGALLKRKDLFDAEIALTCHWQQVGWVWLLLTFGSSDGIPLFWFAASTAFVPTLDTVVQGPEAALLLFVNIIPIPELGSVGRPLDDEYRTHWKN